MHRTLFQQPLTMATVHNFLCCARKAICDIEEALDGMNQHKLECTDSECLALLHAKEKHLTGFMQNLKEQTNAVGLQLAHQRERLELILAKNMGMEEESCNDAG